MFSGTILPEILEGSTLLNEDPSQIISETLSIVGFGLTVNVIDLVSPSQSWVEGVTWNVTWPLILL